MVIAQAAFCSHLRTAADLDLCDLRITVAAANAASISAAHGIDNTAEDTNGRFIRAVRSAANACNGTVVINKCRSYPAVKDGDVSRATITTTDRCRRTIRFCCHLSVLDGNFARTITTAANTCRKIPSLSSYLTAGNAYFTISTEAAANTSRSTYCMDFSVCDFQLRGALLSSSTNTRSVIPAIRVQRGAGIFCCDGQFSGRDLIIFFQACTSQSALQGIVALQLQGRVTFACYSHRGQNLFTHIDIHIFDRDRRVFFGAVVDDRNDMLHRFVHSLCHRAGSVGLKGHDVLVVIFVLCGLLDRLLLSRCLECVGVGLPFGLLRVRRLRLGIRRL